MDQTWIWNRSQQSRLHAVKMSYLKRAREVSRWGGDSSEVIYERLGSSMCAIGVKWRVVEWVKRNALRWFDHIESMKKEICEIGVPE